MCEVCHNTSPKKDVLLRVYEDRLDLTIESAPRTLSWIWSDTNIPRQVTCYIFMFCFVFCFLFQVPPSIRGGNQTIEVTALLDTVVTLECEARGVPLPIITWFRKGEAILSNRQSQYLEQGRFLKIPRVQASDVGQYTCKVTSISGTAEKSFELDIYCKKSIFYDEFLQLYTNSCSFTYRMWEWK